MGNKDENICHPNAVRVLFVNNHGFMGGTERMILLLMDGLKDGSRYCPALVAPPGELTSEAIAHGIASDVFPFARICRSNDPRKWMSSINTFYQGICFVGRIIAHRNISVVHSSSLKSAVMAGIAARIQNTPSLFHVHDYLPAGRLRPLLINTAFWLADGIVANSYSVANIVPAKYQYKTTVVYNKVTIQQEVSAGARIRRRKNLGISNKQLLIGYVGRLHPEKGVEVLLNGFSSVARTNSKAKLWIIGDVTDGDLAYRKSLIQMAERLEIENKTTFWGWRKDAQELMQCLDALVVPSWKEPFGLVTVEAMLLGIPVVATATGGTLEIIDDNITGLLFDPGDSRQLAEKCLEVISDPEKANRMIRLAKSEVERKFGAENYIDGVQKVYVSLAGK